MKKFWSTVVVALALAGMSCGGGIKPVAVASGDQCFRCRRVISEPRLAAEMIDVNHLAYKFRSAGCLAKYLADHPQETGSLFVTDYKTGHMITPERATYVPVVTDTMTMEKDFRAYLAKADAEAAAQTLKVATADWKSVLASGKS